MTTRQRTHIYTENLVAHVAAVIPALDAAPGPPLPAPAAAPTVDIYSPTQGYWQGAAWGAGIAGLAMVQVDANPLNTPFDAFFTYTLPTAAIATAYAAGDRELYIIYQSAAIALYEMEKVHLVRHTWDELETAHTTVGSYGELMTILSSLSHRYVRWENHAYNADGQLTSVELWVYNTKVNCDNGLALGRLMILTFVTTYVNGRPSVSVCS